MNGPKKKWKRRQYLVNPGFQLRFMAYIACAVLAGITVMYVVNYWYLNALVAEGRELGLNPDHVYFEFIDQQRTLLNQAFLGVSVVVFALLMVAGLLLSHKIAGPVYRVQNYTREVIHGDGPNYRVSLRKGDFFPELATIVNDLVEHSRKEAPATTEQDEPDQPAAQTGSQLG